MGVAIREEEKVVPLAKLPHLVLVNGIQEILPILYLYAMDSFETWPVKGKGMGYEAKSRAIREVKLYQVPARPPVIFLSRDYKYLIAQLVFYQLLHLEGEIAPIMVGDGNAIKPLFLHCLHYSLGCLKVTVASACFMNGFAAMGMKVELQRPYR